MTTINSSEYRFLGVYKQYDSLNWNSYQNAANIDYVSFFMQYHIGILPIGTVGWIMQQTIEKYSKAILNKSDSIKYSETALSKKPYSHNISNLWNEMKKVTTQFSYEKAYEDLVMEVDKLTTDTRYRNCSIGLNLGLIETFTMLGCEFRFEILGREEFNKLFFGLQRDLLTPRYFLNLYSFETMFKKLMHISIEHGVSFSCMGIPDTFEHTRVNLSFASGKFCQCGKHIEIEKECPICKNTIWPRNVKEKDEPVKLREFLGM